MTKHRGAIDYAVLIAVMICLVIGWVIKGVVEARTVVFSDAKTGIALAYPANWLVVPERGAILSVMNTRSSTAFSTRVTVNASKWDKEMKLNDYVNQVLLSHSRDLPLFRVISTGPWESKNLKGMEIEYAYAIDPIGPSIGVTSIPIIVRAFDLIVPGESQIYIFTFAADERGFNESKKTFNAILNSITL